MIITILRELPEGALREDSQGFLWYPDPRPLRFKIVKQGKRCIRVAPVSPWKLTKRGKARPNPEYKAAPLQAYVWFLKNVLPNTY